MPLNKRKRDFPIMSDEVATDYKLQQFLEDVQKFTERSKKNNKREKKNRKQFDDSKQLRLKPGLFENGFRSKLCLKENRARLKSNLNDLMKECENIEEKEEETLSSSDQSSFEGSYEIRNQVDDKIDNVPHGNEKVVDEPMRIDDSEKHFATSNKQSENDLKDKYLKEILSEKLGEEMEDHRSDSVSFPNIGKLDHLEIAKRRLNEMIYQTFLENAKQYPSILKRIFSNDEIKRLAQVIEKDKVDKCEQTDDLSVTESVNNCILHGMHPKKDSEIPFPHSFHRSTDDKKDKGNFFDLNQPKKTDAQVDFLESLENQPDIYSPAGQNTASNYNVTPPPSPLPINIQACWAPSTLSTPRKPELFSPNISQPQFSWQKPSISPPESLVINQPNLSTRNRKRKKASQPQFKQNLYSLDSPLRLYFPKRKTVTFSPHRL